MEKTLIILKPDAVEKRKLGAAISRFEDAGFSIVATKMTQLDSEMLNLHYAHIASEPFFPNIEEFMGSRPVLILVLQGHAVIERVRSMSGPTNSLAAAPGTIRGDWGTDMMRNIIHASDSLEAAAAEIDRFFEEDEVYA